LSRIRENEKERSIYCVGSLPREERHLVSEKDRLLQVPGMGWAARRCSLLVEVRRLCGGQCGGVVSGVFDMEFGL
jgi:hypothetical protein